MIDFDPNNLDDLIAQLVARDVEYGFAMARDVGYQMPASYDVGYRRILTLPHPKGATTHFRLRVNDATQDVVTIVPFLDGRTSMADVATLWRETMDRLHTAALTMAHVWLDKHPEAKMSGDAAREAIGRLDLLTKCEADEQRWTAEVQERAKRAQFRKVL
jgi:hypothetical protein